MKKSTLLTQNGLELDCVILFEGKKLPFTGEREEVLVYCQNRLVKGILEEDYVAELETIIDFCIAPDLNELLYEQLQFRTLS